MKLNEIETLISSLKPGEAIHLGHSSVIGNFEGFRIGLDLTTTDGWIPAPFSNLILGNYSKINYLLPLQDVNRMIARPQIAKYLDVILYSHLHPDHFSLNFIYEAKIVNPKLRVICPVNTKEYLYYLEKSIYLKENIVSKIFMPPYRGVIDTLRQESAEQKSARRKAIEFIEEIAPGSTLTIRNRSKSVDIKAYEAIHPPYQFYFRSSYESNKAPLVTYFQVDYFSKEYRNCAFLIGETAVDLEIFSKIFERRNEVKVIFMPITEQSFPKGIKLIEGYFAHQSLLAFAFIERIVAQGTKIVLLHQGLWYFELTPDHINRARLSFQRISLPKTPLPFVALTKELMSIVPLENKSNLFNILTTILNRRRKFARLAKYAGKLPIVGNLDGLPIGCVIHFGNKDLNEKKLPVDAIKSALDAHIAEYEALSAEIESGWDIQKTLLQYTLFIIGTAITLVTAFQNAELLLLVASAMLSLIGWGYIEQSIRMTTIGRYYKYILTPRVNHLLLELGQVDLYQPVADKLKVMNWEDFFRSGNIRTALMGISAGGKFAYAVLPGIAFVLVFYISKLLKVTDWTSFETTAFVVVASLSLLPLVTLIFNARYSFTGEE